MKRSSGTASFLVNGITYSASSGGTNTPGAPNNALTIGCELDASSSAYRFFNGLADEVRISKTARSNDWLIAGYNNQSSPSTFYGVAAEEPYCILPSAAGTITGTSPVCNGQNNIIYSVPAITNATGYTWSYSGSGATISGSTNPVTINFSSTATSGNLTVTGTNACGSGTVSANYAITVNPALTTSVLGKANLTCNGGNDGSIIIQANGGTGSYEFSVDNGENYVSGSNPYTYGGLYANVQYKIRVKDSNGCESPAIN
jgi:hypothetical protein